MSSQAPFQYQSSGFSEAGIFVELYLPKKAKFQGVLYRTLTEGFNFDLVKEHFLGEKETQIKRVLKDHSQWRDYSSESIKEMVPFYWGYSLYEVDGVFYSKLTSGNKVRAIAEERTQVIRIMFLPDLDALAKKLKPNTLEHRDLLDVVKRYLRISGHRRGQYGANAVDRSLIERLEERNDPIIVENIRNGNIHVILDSIERWFDDVGLFLFGYVIFEICAELKKLGDANEVDYEEEIWLTSFWNLNVNRVSYR
jgi:hypothetical protein